MTSHADMISSNLHIQVTESAADAPVYGKDFKMVKITKAIIVPKGSVNGNPTVDLQLEDAAGNKYLIMATGGILENLGAAIKGVRERPEQDKTTH